MTTGYYCHEELNLLTFFVRGMAYHIETLDYTLIVFFEEVCLVVGLATQREHSESESIG